jgi:hypothetical protein
MSLEVVTQELEYLWLRLGYKSPYTAIFRE